MKRIPNVAIIFCIVTALNACGGADPGDNGGDPGGDPGTLFFLDGTWDVETVITDGEAEEIGETFTFEQEIAATDTSVRLVGYGLDENEEPVDLVLDRDGNSVSYSEDEGAYTWTGEFTSAVAFDGTITRTQTFDGESFVTKTSITMSKQ